MNLYFYAPKINATGKVLLSLLKAKPLAFFDGMHFTNKGKPILFDKDDVIVCWGKHVPKQCAPCVINSNLKYVDDTQLILQGLNFVIGSLGANWGTIAYEHYGNYKTYVNALLRLEKEGVKVFNGGLIPCKYVDGYGSAMFKYVKEFKVHVVGKTIVGVCERKLFKDWEEGDVNSLPDGFTNVSSLPQVLGLDFITLTVMLDSHGSCILRKLNTAPDVSIAHIHTYAEALYEIISKNTNANRKCNR